MHLTHRTTCRVCKSSSLTKVIDLGEQHLQGSFLKPGRQVPPLRRVPTSLVRCNPELDEKACGLLQTEHTVPPEVLYSVYWYRSGTNATMTNHLGALAEEAAALYGKPGARVLDIGCNDGTLLKAYPGSFAKFGVDPSDLANEVPAGITVVHDLFPSDDLFHALEGKPCDIVTSIAMFYDLEDPIAFARAIKRALSPDGLWCVEMSYMPTMLRMTSYDTICHEHLEYYSLAVLEHIMKQADLRLVNVSLNAINGGSIRCYATHADNRRYRRDEFTANIKRLRQEEFDLELDTDKPYRNFQERVNVHKQELLALLRKLRAEGKRIHAYGASTKGNTILQWCGIDSRLVDVAAERNPDKFGARTLGSDIPIVSEEESRQAKPDYYLVLPWHFRDEFVEREKALLASGVGMIFPLPTIEIVRGSTKG
ncbi:MAG TPA: class I SAM-dependent methyltransferase [Polyangia bacterium]|jgi:SAM-dependent methyltransferase|nr:class I SAM-dependent methyltransferase [Polyangia bacterium]